MLAPFPSTPLWVNRKRFGIEIFDNEIIANGWDVAQVQARNEDLTCYVDYSKAGGLNRHQIKELWLEYREKYDKLLKERGKHSIQQEVNKEC